MPTIQSAGEVINAPQTQLTYSHLNIYRNRKRNPRQGRVGIRAHVIPLPSREPGGPLPVAFASACFLGTDNTPSPVSALIVPSNIFAGNSKRYVQSPTIWLQPMPIHRTEPHDPKAVLAADTCYTLANSAKSTYTRPCAEPRKYLTTAIRLLPPPSATERLG